MFDDSNFECPSLWIPFASSSYTNAADAELVDCTACITKLPHVIHFETLKALVDCRSLAIFVSKNVRLPIEAFWFHVVYRSFRQKFILHVLLTVVFVAYVNVARHNDEILPYVDFLEFAEYGMAAILIFSVCFIAMNECRQLRSLGFRTYVIDPSNWCDVISIVAVVGCVFQTSRGYSNDTTAAPTMFVHGIKLLFFLEGFEQTSFVVKMLFNAVMDLRGFGFVFLCLYILAVAIFRSLLKGEIAAEGLGELTFRMMLGDLEVADDIGSTECMLDDENGTTADDGEDEWWHLIERSVLWAFIVRYL